MRRFAAVIALQLGIAATQTTFAAPIKVQVAFVEALAPKDTTSSERFQKEYEAAVAIGKSHSQAALSKCGYDVSEKLVFYDASDSVQALEQAKKLSAEGSWLLVGPRRSNHYLLLVKGAPEIPSVSIMASAKEISELGALHLSLAPANNTMAKVAAATAKDKSKRQSPTYLSVVSGDCVTCVDFAADFSKHAETEGLLKLGELIVTGDSPNLKEVVAIIQKQKPDFVLLPNYSKVSAAVIHAVMPVHPKVIFIGGDGWGDAKFGFIQNNDNVGSAKGFTVRGFPPHSVGLEKFELGKRVLKDTAADQIASGSSLAIIKAFDGLTKILCEKYPKDSREFAKAFSEVGQKHLSAPWGVSIYSLKSGDIVYSKTRK
jgi:ABC-type branched-subunit amino acid transport system substrate-binding protein